MLQLQSGEMENTCAYMLLLLSVVLGSASERRDISEIRYEFTTCGFTGRTGPIFNACKNHYTTASSPSISRDNVLITIDDYRGAQGFRVPRGGLYNITVVGAAGGRGICNHVPGGRGVVRTVQVNLTTEFDLLVMVGQSGIEPCDLIPEEHQVYGEICANPPTFGEESDSCNATWYNLTRDFDVMFTDVFGGGGGGGASMVRARNRTSGMFDDFPIVIAGGGGGSPAVLDFNVVDEIDIGNRFISNGIQYASFLNGRSRTVDTGIEGIRGSRVTSTGQTAGAGGGYSLGILRLIEVDGRSFRSPQDFGDGGLDCAQALLNIRSDSAANLVPFHGTFGGFGGGGGACGGSGGGGGYTGGTIRGVGNTVPGGGGFSFTGDDKFTSFDVAPARNDFSNSPNSTDGYVNIVLANCGCVHECIVYEEDDQFECQCPNDTKQAPDLSDCFFETEISVEEGHVKSVYLEEESISYTYSVLQFENVTSIFSIYVQMNAGNVLMEDQEDDARCVVLFTGANQEIVLASNVISVPGNANELTLVVNSTHTGIYTDFLTSAILVTGGFVFGTGGVECTLGKMAIAANVSIQEASSPAVIIKNEDSLMNALVQALEIADQLLSSPSEKDVPTTLSRHNRLIVVVVTTVLGFVGICGTLQLFLLVLYVKTRGKRKSQHPLQGARLGQRPNDSLVANSAYSKFGIQAPEHPEDNRMRREISVSNRYEELNFNSLGSKRSSRTESKSISVTHSFRPRYGISVPHVDFSEFNRNRSGTTLSDSHWHYPRSKLTYMKELGEGQFGKVLLMKAKNIAGFNGRIAVAVKTLTSQDPEIIEKFKEEAELMKKFVHPNIVSLLGYIPQEEGEESAPLMILEYMPFGDLLGFLNSHSPRPGNSIFLTDDYLCRFALDIALGLEFLSKHDFVHRDIAARNCLVGPCLRIKIADFGLARGLQDKDYYRVGGNAVLPVKWMAPESLLFGIFSSASDVWSYGVLLWEIMMYGKPPLGGMEVQGVINAAETGTLCHPRPDNCLEDLYSLMVRCHERDSDKRPTFSDIVSSPRLKQWEQVVVVDADVEESEIVSTCDPLL